MPYACGLGASHPPGPRSGCASAPASPSRLFGHVSECLRRLCVAVAGEGGETGGDEGQLVDRRFSVFLEVAKERAGGDPRMPSRFLAGDQERQLERIGEPQPRELLGRRLGDD
jgi:hypothetical protein